MVLAIQFGFVARCVEQFCKSSQQCDLALVGRACIEAQKQLSEGEDADYRQVPPGGGSGSQYLYSVTDSLSAGGILSSQICAHGMTAAF